MREGSDSPVAARSIEPYFQPLMTKAPARHLVTVWNPAYAAAMDETIQLLLDRARDLRAETITEDEVYVWWGKVKSSNRQQRMPHLDEVIAIDRELQVMDGDPPETHLYITDYRSLYVGHVAEITADDVRRDDAGSVPRFYSAANLECDCWFRLFDIRRVVFDDTVGVVEELRKLANTRYNDRPVSIYGGMVDLPIIATRKDGARYFEPDVRDQLTGGLFWVEFDAQRSGVGHMEREIRENLLGDATWTALDPAARGFIATAETLFRNHRTDPAFDFSPVLIDFAKAFEVQVNLILRRALRLAKPAERTFNIDGRSVDLARGQMLSLGQLAHVMSNDEQLNTSLKRLVSHGEWFTASLPPTLKELSDRRNPAAHSARITADEATKLRNRLMGVGCLGVFVELGRVTPK
jgi:hypothetical protein